MEVKGTITGIKYNAFSGEKLKEVLFTELDINKEKGWFLLKHKTNTFGVSKWISPKRTRSYPYERVYNTLTCSKKITIIPIVKDEGKNGDRDFLQWDTVSLMSLLDVYVIFAYYNNAKTNKFKTKVTKQELDNNYIKTKINEIESYKSSALHWNLNEVNCIDGILSKVQFYYDNISKKLGIEMHSEKGLSDYKEKIKGESSKFIQFSRDKAKKAQEREIQTEQPKEEVEQQNKGKITLKNYLGGEYYFTCDEIIIEDNKVVLIESKHSKNNILPSKGDVKDGLLKMVLYSNLTEVETEGKTHLVEAVLRLTSENIVGKIDSNSTKCFVEEFVKLNKIKSSKAEFINTLFNEANINKFKIQISEVNHK